jgi:hypothetical protein
VEALDVPPDAKTRLLTLTPHTYLGYAEMLTNEL